MTPNNHIAILGAGPAGLAAGFYAQKHELPFTLYEAGAQVGGNARTLHFDDFLVDTGAHRFHGHDPRVTKDVVALMGDELQRIDVPSQIMFDDRFIDFPLSPLNLIDNFGVWNLLRAQLEYVCARIYPANSDQSFKSVAQNRYGKTIADAFLLTYTEKLWGLPADRLSPAVSGQRLKGLNLKTFVIESFLGSRSKTEHLDGTFYYPRHGIGRIMERLAEECGRERIRLNARVSRIFHSNSRITGIEINDRERIEITDLISTLPLGLFINLLEPAAPEKILALTRRIHLRNVTLVVLFLNREQVTPNASLYFPDADTPFTRVYEPRNRSRAMSPPGKTSLAVEFPCGNEDACWTDDSSTLIQQCAGHLIKRGLFQEHELIGGAVHRIPAAYPILELGFEEIILELLDYLDSFRNLRLTGRNARFAYTHIHDLMKSGRETVEELL